MSSYMQNTMPDHVLHHLSQVNYYSFKYLEPLSLLLLPIAMASSKQPEFKPQRYDSYNVPNNDEEYDEEEEDDDDYKEKQISVDPMSLNNRLPPPLPVLPPFIKPNFISASLPSSATSSPLSFKKRIHLKQNHHPAFHSSLTRQHSVTQLHSMGMLLTRSKSCGDGRSSQPSDEFDIISRRYKVESLISARVGLNEPGKRVYPQCAEEKEEFKCGVMCLFLPGLARKKQEQAKLRRKAIQEEDYYYYDDDDEKEESRSVTSRVASFEKFECGSWSSAVILDENEEDDEEGMNAYFDLPLELIRGSGEDPHSPVKTAFIFDKEPKGVLKKSTRKSHESNRHVRFSTSMPMSYPASPNSACITPRLLQAREEFNALVEAQNASINF